MLVSNFSLARYPYKTDFREQTRYGLQITNLDDAELEFAVECHISVPEGETAPLAYMTGNVLARFDRGGVAYLTLARQGAVVKGEIRVRIPPKASANYLLEKTTTDQRELSGFIVLRVPGVRPLGMFRLSPQADHAVRVLLHAHRTDCRVGRVYSALDMEGRAHLRTAVGDSYSSESVQLASGHGENEIVPEQLGFLQVGAVSKYREALKAGHVTQADVQGAALLPEEERVPALLDLLVAVASSAKDVEATNEFLAQNKVKLRLHR
jgi:hypothetical protein